MYVYLYNKNNFINSHKLLLSILYKLLFFNFQLKNSNIQNLFQNEK